MSESVELKGWWNERQDIYTKNGYSKYIAHQGVDKTFKFLKIENKLIKSVRVLIIGVGEGLCTKELSSRDIEVQVLDISSLALSRVKDYVKKSYLVDSIKDLPEDYFDVVIHHLVVQHLSDEYLKLHLKYGIRSLKKDGIFAMQFADAKRNPEAFVGDGRSLRSQMYGGCIRTIDEMRSFVKKARGKCRQVNTILLPKNVTWYAVHIKKG